MTAVAPITTTKSISGYIMLTAHSSRKVFSNTGKEKKNSLCKASKGDNPQKVIMRIPRTETKFEHKIIQ